MNHDLIGQQDLKDQAEETAVCKAVLLTPDYGREDDCSLCVHEHENWGNNEHCRACSKRCLL